MRKLSRLCPEVRHEGRHLPVERGREADLDGEQQEADCRRYDDEHGPAVTEIFIGVGFSTHGVHHMLDAAEWEDVTVLIVADLARLGSKYADHVAVVQQLHDEGVDIHVTKERTSASGHRLSN